MNQSLPDRIIVYRDGVDEGAMKSVLEHEVEQLVGSCRTYNPSYEPKIIYIVVLKRIAIRYFALQVCTLLIYFYCWRWLALTSR